MDLGGSTGLVLPGSGAGFLGFKTVVSVGGGGVRSRPDFSARLLEWGNSRSVTVFWAVLGCICSFLCPAFLFLAEGQAVGDIGSVRLVMMLLTCITMAGVYRAGFLLRHDRIMREGPPWSVRVVGNILTCCIHAAIGISLEHGGTWPTVIGLQLVIVALFVLLEMTKPVYDFNMFQIYAAFPIIAGLRRHGWEFVYLGWPMEVVLHHMEVVLSYRGSCYCWSTATSSSSSVLTTDTVLLLERVESHDLVAFLLGIKSK